MKFIELDDKITGLKVLININNISQIYQTDDGKCYIIFNNDNRLTAVVDYKVMFDVINNLEA